jgi:TetR/AcrR family transcriptional repressor of nem operon
MPILVLLTCTFKAICAARADDSEGRGCLIVNSLSELGNTNLELGNMLKDAVRASAAGFEDIL